MSRERLIRELIARFNAGDFRDLAPRLTDDVVFVVQEDSPNGARYEGRAAYVEAQAESSTSFASRGS
ncbi:MAG: hypothetical protein H0T15_09575 [Thermoleophilaceae bacterium]|nr:hypothetical protein [Thermoleophilaceae bacterium]